MTKLADLAEIWRGDVLESRHMGVAAVANAKGEVIAGWGDTTLLTYPRSSLKPFQALPLIETGAADAMGLTDRHLALACASHRGEAHHSALVRDWLDALGASPDDLACGPEYPKHTATQHKMIANGEAPGPEHHNCSGKHTGFLTVCHHCGYGAEGYDAFDHPVQDLYAGLLDDLGATPASWGTDGCTLPSPALTVGDTARLGALLAGGLQGARGAAAARLIGAMRAFPKYTSGTDHAMEALIAATGGRVVFKGGAEAFLLAFLETEKLGIAIKVADGNSRARVPALIAILRGLDLLSAAEHEALTQLAAPPITESRGRVVGRISAAEGLSAAE